MISISVRRCGRGEALDQRVFWVVGRQEQHVAGRWGNVTILL